MKILLVSLLAIFSSIASYSQHLKISENKRYIENNDGTSFLWIGDTAWELFHKLNREEATEYLTNRAEQGFSIIQAVALAENDGLRTPNSYGEVPLINFDPTQPNNKYFKHVDFIVNKANELGLYIGMLPTWGDKIFSEHPGAGPIVFNAENARIFGEYLGKRYKNKKIVWILGGDRNVANDEVLGIWRAMAEGLKEGDEGNHLISYHPRGGSHSSYYFHNDDWLDFNMYQSGHSNKFNHVFEYAKRDYLIQPVKPFVDGEPAYEDIAVRFWEYLDFSKRGRTPGSVLDEKGLIKDREYFKDGFFTAHDIRVHGYWNFLSGACGYTYGNNAVWQMFKKGGNIAIPCLTDWREALTREGANQIRYIRKLFKSRDFSEMIPDQSVIYGINPKGSKYVTSAVQKEGKWLIVYLSMGQPVKVVMKKITDSEVNAWWYNPRNGESSFIDTYKNEGLRTFTPPSSGIDNDWVLVLDAGGAELGAPGLGGFEFGE